MWASARPILLSAAIAAASLTGCPLFSKPEPTISLSEYLNLLNEQIRLRDEQAWLTCLVQYHQKEPFIVSVIADKEGRASFTVGLKTVTNNKTTSTGSAKVSSTPEIGVSGSAEKSVGAENTITATVSFLDRGLYLKVYESLEKLFKDCDANSIYVVMSDDQWNEYKKKNPEVWPHTRFRKRHYVVDEEHRPKFRELIKEIHALPPLDKPPDKPAEEATRPADKAK